MFKKFSEYVRHHPFCRYLRHCAICQLSCTPITWLCLRCTQILEENYLEPKDMVRLNGSHLHVRLIDWHNQNDQWMRLLIQSLKGDYKSPLFEILAEEFWYRIRQINSLSQDAPFCLIPCPSRSFKKDHGFYLADELAQKMKFPIKNILRHPTGEQKQKRKEVFFRKQKTLELISKDLPSDHRIVFVDDILTTGSTAMSAYKALGKPQPFMIWTLFWRRYSEKKIHFN